MNWLLITIIVCAGGAAIALILLVLLCRIGAGESDVNGDPERDSGGDGSWRIAEKRRNDE